MPDLSAALERILKLMELDHAWHVVASLTNAIGTIFTIQNDAGLKVQFLFTPSIQFPNADEANISRIRNAITKATSK